METEEELRLTFIDLSDRQVTWYCLEAIGAPRHIIQKIKSTYNMVKAQV